MGRWEKTPLFMRRAAVMMMFGLLALVTHPTAAHASRSATAEELIDIAAEVGQPPACIKAQVSTVRFVTADDYAAAEIVPPCPGAGEVLFTLEVVGFEAQWVGLERDDDFDAARRRATWCGQRREMPVKAEKDLELCDPAQPIPVDRLKRCSRTRSLDPVSVAASSAVGCSSARMMARALSNRSSRQFPRALRTGVVVDLPGGFADDPERRSLRCKIRTRFYFSDRDDHDVRRTTATCENRIGGRLKVVFDEG